MGKELDKHITSCRRCVSLMKEECLEVMVGVRQLKPLLTQAEKLMSQYLQQRFGEDKDPKKAEKTYKEFLKTVKSGVSITDSIRDARGDLEGDLHLLQKALERLRKHVALREKKSLFRSKANTKEAKDLVKAYSHFSGMAMIATEDAFRLGLDFLTFESKYLRA